MANQFRNYCLTVNNPKLTDLEFFDYLKTLPHLKYFTFQRERGEQEGTEHHQLYIEFTLGKRFEIMKEYFSENAIGVNAHIENRTGKKDSARNYCQKADTRISESFFEFGEFVEERERSDITDILAMAKNGSSFVEIESAFPAQAFRYYRHIETAIARAQRDIQIEQIRNVHVTYIYGAPGTGKTTYVYDHHKPQDICRITHYDKYNMKFDHYNGQPVLVFDEFRSQIDISDMLNYLDKWYLELPARFNNRVARYTTVYIISNWRLDGQYQYEPRTSHTWQALLRRIHRIIDFNGGYPRVVPPPVKVSYIDSDGKLINDKIPFGS
jgi:hypothetical protein